MTSGHSRSGVGLRSERGPVLAALMLATALVAIDSTIIATAVPSIVRDVGGFTQFPWLFSIYVLTQAVTVPLYSRFADVAGRRGVLQWGIALFLLGSVLCGTAWNMPVLIISRGIQGLGAGAVQPISMTVVGDLYTVQERARVQGYIASVWGASSVIGPSLGGLFSQYLSWRWIFFVNLPVGVVAAWMLHRHLHERFSRRRHRIDYAGATTLTTGCSLLILGLLEGGVAWPWRSPLGVGVPSLAVALLIVFVLVERRAREPVLPLWVFRYRVLLGANLTGLTVGAILIGLSSYVPTYVQGVLGAGAVVAGFTVAALSIGWPIAAALVGRVYLRIGFRNAALIGTAVTVAGTLACVALTVGSAIWHVAAACFLVGVGLGLCSSPIVVAAQSVVGWERRGVVTGAGMFCRSLGSAVGVAVFGAIANATLAARLTHPPSTLAGRLPPAEQATRTLLDAGASAPATALPDPLRAELAYLRSVLFEATHRVFLALLVVAILSVAAVALIPRRTRPLPLPEDSAVRAPAEAGTVISPPSP